MGMRIRNVRTVEHRPYIYIYIERLIIEHHREWLTSLADYFKLLLPPTLPFIEFPTVWLLSPVPPSFNLFPFLLRCVCNTTVRNMRGHLQTDLRRINVIMTFRGRGYPRDVNVQKCMHKPTFLVKTVMLRRWEGGFQLNIKMTLSVQKSVWRCPLSQGYSSPCEHTIEKTIHTYIHTYRRVR